MTDTYDPVPPDEQQRIDDMFARVNELIEQSIELSTTMDAHLLVLRALLIDPHSASNG